MEEEEKSKILASLLKKTQKLILEKNVDDQKKTDEKAADGIIKNLENL